MESRTRLFGEPVPVPKRTAAAEMSRKEFPQHFVTTKAARDFLFQAILPPSMRWCFMSVGKNASSSTLRFLFRAEFDCELTVNVTPRSDINPSAQVHMLTEHRLFSRALLLGISAPDLLGAEGPQERICVVRDPFARAISAFRYLCRSHILGSRWFAFDRFRMNAVSKFNWERDVDTERGFIIFLEYVAWQIDADGPEAVNAHWQPQFTFIKPAVFNPTVIGRMEDLGCYFRTLSERLDAPFPEALPWDNRQPTAPQDLRSSMRAQAICKEIYAADYEAFGY
jgi:hypothetical protein